MSNQELYKKIVNLSNECHNKTISESQYIFLNKEGEKLMNNDEVYTEVDLSVIENEIISAIELTSCDLDNKQGPQSAVWEKIYEALDKIRKKSTSWKWGKDGVKEIISFGDK
jgi:TRAP-type mannitol/chloroaromatic compound transport system substrate-binding protein